MEKNSGAFDENRYWDVYAEYAKASPNDVLCMFTVYNRGPEESTLHVLPQLWYRNTWIWGCTHEVLILLILFCGYILNILSPKCFSLSEFQPWLRLVIQAMTNSIKLKGNCLVRTFDQNISFC